MTFNNIPDNINFGRRYQTETVLSHGALGECFLVKDIRNNTRKVIKVISLDFWKTLNESSIKLIELKHNNIVKIYDVAMINDYPCIVEDYISGINLDIFNQNNVVTLKICLQVMHDMLNALKYLQKMNLSHKDIKPSNIIYDPVLNKATLIDIDYVAIENQRNQFIGTIKYSAPEKITQNLVSISSDCYSLGMVICYLMLEEIPTDFNLKYQNSILINSLKNVIESNHSLDKIIKQKYFSLLESLLAYEEDKRISIDNALKDIKIIQKLCEEKNQENIILKESNPHLNSEISSRTVSLTFFTTIHNTSLQDNNVEYQKDNMYENEQSSQVVVQDDRVEYQKGTISGSKQDFKNQKNSVYQRQLLKEYDNILFEAKTSFALWVLSMIIYFSLFFVVIYLIINEKYIQGACSALLDTFVLGIQQLFKIREDHYRNMVEQKIDHLKKVDYLEYLFEKNEDLDDNIEKRNAEVIKLLDKINKYTNDHENEQ